MNHCQDKAKKLPKQEFIEAVKRMPLVSFDVIVKNMKGEVLLGLRKNEPARGYWFVPGGIIRKSETLGEAFTRIGADELGVELDLSTAIPHGVFEHFYESNAAEIEGITTHYVVLAYEIELSHPISSFPAEQHAEYKWFAVEELLCQDKVHPYSKAYFKRE
jgi:colanic acid biosynthesis protein WcaH